jgi:excisionase family DNA binding protein
MSVFKRCKCKDRDRCDHPWIWKMQVKKVRRSGSIDEFAAWHSGDEAPNPVREKSVAQLWERRIRQAIRKGVDPAVLATAPAVRITRRPAVGDRYLDAREAAEYLNVNEKTIRNATLRIDHPLRHARVGNRLRFKREWLDEWAERRGA